MHSLFPNHPTSTTQNRREWKLTNWGFCCTLCCSFIDIKPLLKTVLRNRVILQKGHPLFRYTRKCPLNSINWSPLSQIIRYRRVDHWYQLSFLFFPLRFQEMTANSLPWLQDTGISGIIFVNIVQIIWYKHGLYNARENQSIACKPLCSHLHTHWQVHGVWRVTTTPKYSKK